MPKDDIDYSNTIIYKIYCIDKTITDVYIGHTTNFTKRKYQHKFSCSNLGNKLKIYNIIRQTGGWNNWNMIEISKYNCKDKTEARIKELFHYEELNSTLNSCPPYVDKKKNMCSICNLQCKSSKLYETHINCSRHKKKIEATNTRNFCCKQCDYSTSRKSQYDRHIITDKHQTLTNPNLSYSKNCVNYECSCGKSYKHSSSLSAHKKNCNPKNNKTDTSNNEFVFDKEFVMMVLKQNNELHTQMIEHQTKMMDHHNHMVEVIKNIAKGVIIDKTID